MAGNGDKGDNITVVVTPNDGTLNGTTVTSAAATVVDAAPTGLALSETSVAENRPSGTPVGTFSNAVPDVGNTFAYTLVSGTGSTDNSSFVISDNVLQTAASFNYETQSSYAIRVRTTGQGGLWFEEPFTVTVTDVNEPPRVVRPIPDQTAPANRQFRFTLAQDAFVDVDFGQSMRYAVTQADGSLLPKWLEFDSPTGTFSGRPLVRDVGQIRVRVTATDSGSPPLAASAEFTINVTSYPFPFQNVDLPQDADGSGLATPLDVLILIN